jgi:hypothetical protein
MSESSRTEVDATDYFGHQKKKLGLADRRPVIRKASDLVGPGINANATRITNFNDLLATYNGFFAADAGALVAPNSTDQFSGITVSDAELGGTQVFSSLSTGITYRRVFTRSPLDASSVLWGAWAETEMEDRIEALEAVNADARLDTLEARPYHPLYTGMMTFFGTSLSHGNTISGTDTFPVTFPSAPVAWGIRAGFVTGASNIIVAAVDSVTTTGLRVVLMNAGPSVATFTDLPIRWFAQMPN